MGSSRSGPTRVAAPSAHFSQAIAIEAKGKLVFVSGMTARKPDGTIAGVGDIEEQTRQVCENIKQTLEAAGARMDDVCRIDVFCAASATASASTRCARSSGPPTRRRRRWSRCRSWSLRNTWSRLRRSP
jgi:enamine deaminase RidA (YjgF/YER057c/UK114 family)